jgi:hypothetical protein
MSLRITVSLVSFCLTLGVVAAADAGEGCCGSAAGVAAEGTALAKACDAAGAATAPACGSDAAAAKDNAACPHAAAGCANCPGPDKCPHGENCPHADCACKKAAGDAAPGGGAGE